MSASIWRFIIILGALVLFGAMLGLLIKKPNDKARHILVNASSGFFVILLVNTFVASSLFTVPINLLSLSAAAVFGIPGVALALALNALLT